jgi:hypothetical protein
VNPNRSDPMKSILADVNVPLADIAATRKREREFREDMRRHRVELANPNTPRKSPWKIKGVDQPLPPAWQFERDKDGTVIRAKQMRPQANGIDTEPAHLGRRFLLEITEQCIVGGEHIPAGARVDCLADAAFSLHGFRGKIVEETRE